jgi:hypothetical protein
VPVGRPSNQPGMPGRVVSTSRDKRSRALVCVLTVREEAWQGRAQHALPRLCDAADAALDVVDDVLLLEVAVAAVPADGRGRDNGRADYDSRGDGRRVRQGDGARKTQRRAQQHPALRCVTTCHGDCAQSLQCKMGEERGRRVGSRVEVWTGDAATTDWRRR